MLNDWKRRMVPGGIQPAVFPVAHNIFIMTSWHRNTFSIIGPLWGESTSGDQTISSQRASDAKLWCFLCLLTWTATWKKNPAELAAIWDAMTFMCPYYNVKPTYSTVPLYGLDECRVCLRLQHNPVRVDVQEIEIFQRRTFLGSFSFGGFSFVCASFQVILFVQSNWWWQKVIHHNESNVLASTLKWKDFISVKLTYH